MNGNLPKMMGKGALLPVNRPPNLSQLIRGRGTLLPSSSSSKSGSGLSDQAAKQELPQATHRDPIETEDPMKQAFEHEQNVYEEGPGSRLPRSAQIPGNEEPRFVKLHISNIPSALSRAAVENIFSIHGNPKNIFVKELPGHPTTWGFVEFETMSEAQTVISNISHQPPHYMSVKIARDKEAKESEIRSPPNEKEPMPKPAPREHPPARIYGANPQKQHSKVFNENDSSGPSTQAYGGLSGTAHVPSKIEEQNRAYFNQVGTNDTFGDRKLKNGSVVLASKPPADVVVHPNVVPYNEKDPTATPLAPQLLTYGIGFCENCNLPTFSRCTHCKTFYCCYPCIEAQWPEHKLVCRPKRVVLLPNGCIEVEDVTAEPSAAIAEKPIDSNSLAKPKVAEQSGEPSFRKFGQMNGKADDSGKSAEVIKSISSPKIDESKTKTLLEARMAPVPYEGRTGYYKTEKGSLVTDDTKKLEKEVVVREAAVVDVQKAKVEERHLVTKAPAEPPIPRGTFTTCIVLFSEPENTFHYVSTSLQMDQLAKMVHELNESLDRKGVQLKNFEVNTLCATRYQDYWYRAKITSAANSEHVNVLFIDFGNEESSKKSDLRVLPPEFSTIPPLAFKIHLFSGKQSLSENSEIQISPVKELDDGSWLVRFASDPEPVEEERPSELEIPVKPSEKLQETTGAISNEKAMENQEKLEEDTKKRVSPYALSKDQFVQVNIMHREDSDILWVVTDRGLDRLLELSQILEEHCEKQVRKIQVEKHRVYASIFANVWCRVLILSTNPCRGTYIDYGNTAELNPDDLRTIPTEHEQESPLAIRIKLADGTPKKYFTPDIETLSVQVVKKVENAFLAIVKGETYPVDVSTVAPQQITLVGSPKVTKPKKHVIEALSFGTMAEVLITKTFGQNCVCGAIQLPGYPDCPDLLSISDLLVSAKRNPGYKPALNDDVIVKIDNDNRLFRGYIMCLDGETVGAALIDFGCVVKPIELWPLPSELKGLPSSAVRILFYKPLSLPESRLLGKVLKLTDVQPDDSAVTASLGDLGRAEIKPWAPFVEEAPILQCELPDKCKVVITAFYSPSTLYVRPLVKECLNVFQEALQDVAAYGISAEPLGRVPICGELVAARWPEDNQWYRGVVSKREGDKFRITFLDFGNDTLVGLDSLKGLPANYKKLPSTVVKIGLKKLPYSVFNDEATDMMNQYILQEIALVASHEGDLRNVELSVASSGDILNNILVKKIEESRQTKLDSFYSVTDLKFDRWEPKTKFTVVTVGTTAYNEFSAVRQSPIFAYVCNILTPEISKYCEKAGGSPYAPRQYEMVLAKYDGAWYRAMCLNYSIGQPIASITFVDFGNHGDQPIDEIKPMVHDFMSTPATARACVIYGLPPAESLTDDVKVKLMKSYDKVTEVFVVEDEGILECVVWVPQLVGTLKSLGIPFTAPVGFSTPEVS